MPKLYIVATPIGNLKDITLRALETLKEVDLILCEDTRVTKRLLEHYDIKTKFESYHQHSNLKKVDYILNLFEQGKNLALVSDCGTPGINDPGDKLVKEAIKIGVEIIPIPGPSAVTAILSVLGAPADKFTYMGFPPHKKGRQTMFKEISESKYPVVIYESVHRIIKALKELNVFGEFDIVIGRELTKKFETIYRGKIKDIINQLEKEGPKGEFVIIINQLKNEK